MSHRLTGACHTVLRYSAVLILPNPLSISNYEIPGKSYSYPFMDFIDDDPKQVEHFTVYLWWFMVDNCVMLAASERIEITWEAISTDR